MKQNMAPIFTDKYNLSRRDRDVKLSPDLGDNSETVKMKKKAFGAIATWRLLTLTHRNIA